MSASTAESLAAELAALEALDAEEEPLPASSTVAVVPVPAEVSSSENAQELADLVSNAAEALEVVSQAMDILQECFEGLRVTLARLANLSVPPQGPVEPVDTGEPPQAPDVQENDDAVSNEP